MNINFKTPEILAAIDNAHKLGLELKQVYEAKNMAITEKRLEDAARFREKEVKLIEQIRQSIS